jgi:hypothetical protein
MKTDEDGRRRDDGTWKKSEQECLRAATLRPSGKTPSPSFDNEEWWPDNGDRTNPTRANGVMKIERRRSKVGGVRPGKNCCFVRDSALAFAFYFF